MRDRAFLRRRLFNNLRFKARHAALKKRGVERPGRSRDDGAVDERSVEVGNIVSPGATLMTDIIANYLETDTYNISTA